MSYLRKIAKTIETMDLLVTEYPEVVKEELEQNTQNILILNTIMKNYIEELENCYEDIKHKYEEMTRMEVDSIFFKISKFFWMKKAQKTMKRCLELMAYSQQLYKKTEKIKTRVKQFKYFS